MDMTARNLAAAALSELDDADVNEGTELAGYHLARADVYARLAQAAAIREAAEKRPS